jgi:hemolysin III
LRQRMPSIYSPAEWWSDAAIHAIGLLAALIAVPVIITLAALWFGDAGIITATAIYGATLIVLFAASAVNNLVAVPAWQQFLRRIDRSAIYLKIAGTYTPLAVLAGGHLGTLLTSVWGTALAGVSLMAFHPDRVKWLTLALYIALGWAGLLVGGPMLAGLSPAGLVLVFTGGGLYMLGILFFLWQRLPFHNTIWHALVLAASVVFYTAILIELLGKASVT